MQMKVIVNGKMMATLWYKMWNQGVRQLWVGIEFVQLNYTKTAIIIYYILIYIICNAHIECALLGTQPTQWQQLPEMRLSSHRGDRSVALYIAFKTLAFHDAIVLAYEYIIHNFGIYEMLRQSTKLNFHSFVADRWTFAKNPITRHTYLVPIYS